MSHYIEENISVSVAGEDNIILHTLVSISGRPSRRPTLLLLHYWGGSNRTFSSLIPHLRDDFNLLAPSLRGWGKSSRPVKEDSYHIANYVDDIVCLISHITTERPQLLENGVILVGHSMSAKIAQVLLTRPDVASISKGLVLIAPAPVTSFELPTSEMREQQLHAYDNVVSARFVVENVLLGRPTAVAEDEIVALANDASSGSHAAKKAWPAYGMGEDFGNDVSEAIRDAHVNVLVVVGALDRIEPPSRVREVVVRQLEEAGAHVTVKEVSDVGHLIPAEAPGALAESIMAFFDGIITSSY